MNLKSPDPRRRVDGWVARDVLLEFIRSTCPDVRIRKVRLDDGRRGCGARFTFRGEVLEVEAIESPELPDPDDAVVRRCAYLIWRRLGVPTRLDDAERARREREIVDAARRGDAALADELGRELAMINEGYAATARMRAPFER